MILTQCLLHAVALCFYYFTLLVVVAGARMQAADTGLVAIVAGKWRGGATDSPLVATGGVAVVVL